VHGGAEVDLADGRGGHGKKAVECRGPARNESVGEKVPPNHQGGVVADVRVGNDVGEQGKPVFWGAGVEFATGAKLALNKIVSPCRVGFPAGGGGVARGAGHNDESVLFLEP
jgi:hypothetical protein